MIKYKGVVGYTQSTREDFAVTQLEKDLAAQYQTGEYKLLSEVRLAFYRTQISGLPLDTRKFHYQLVIPAEGDNFSYYDDFKKFI